MNGVARVRATSIGAATDIGAVKSTIVPIRAVSGMAVSGMAATASSAAILLAPISTAEISKAGASMAAAASPAAIGTVAMAIALAVATKDVTSPIAIAAKTSSRRLRTILALARRAAADSVAVISP